MRYNANIRDDGERQSDGTVYNEKRELSEVIMKTVFTAWEKYDNIERCSVTVQIIVSVFVIVYAILFIAGAVHNIYVAEIGMGIAMMAQGIREWRKNKVLAIFSFVVVIFIAFAAVSIYLRR